MYLRLPALVNHADKKVGIITVYPADTETTRVHINTYECFNELERIDGICASFILDNNRGEKMKLNKEFVEGFTAMVEVTDHLNVTGNIDKAEIKEILSTRGATVIANLGKEFTTISQLIGGLKDGIYTPLEDDRTIRYIGLSTATTLDLDALYKEFGRPLDTFQGRQPERTICVLSGLSYPYTRLEKTRDYVERTRPDIQKSAESVRTTRLADNINFVAGEKPTQKPITKPGPSDFLAKYKTRDKLVEAAAVPNG